MSPLKKATREHWISVATSLLARGRVAGTVSQQELCELAGVSKGSFYSHFPGGMGELDAEVIERWRRENSAEVIRDAVAGVRDPPDLIRLLWERSVRTIPADGAMRRWAAEDSAAARAIAARDAELASQVGQALVDLGYPLAEAQVLAWVLIQAFAGAFHSLPEPLPADSGHLETLLGILRRANQEQAQAQQAVPDAVEIYRLAAELPAAARTELRDRALKLSADSAATLPPRGRGAARHA